MRREESFRGSAGLLAAAGGIEFALQLAIPILLARYLDELAFSQYRLLWLVAGTALAVATMFMPQSLFYFLGRVRRRDKSIYVGNVAVYLLAAGALCALAVSNLNPWLQDDVRALFVDTRGLSAVFLGLWVAAALLDTLPTADGRARWQAGAIVALAVLRTALLAAAALLYGSIEWVAAAMLGVAAAKLGLAALYMHSCLPRSDTSWEFGTLRIQLAYALPFAVGNALFLLRVQADQWVVVTLLPAALFASFSVAAVILPVATLVRQPVVSAMLPRLNRAYGAGRRAEAAQLIALGNGATALMLIPVAGVLLACAPELVELMYTSRYREAAPVMQIYLVGMMINAVAVGHTLSALGHGRSAMIISACCLLLSVFLCVAGVMLFGMRGAAAATMLTLAIGELWALQVVARTLRSSVRELINWRALLPACSGVAGGLILVWALPAEWELALWQGVLLKAGAYAVGFVPGFVMAGGVRAMLTVLGSRDQKPMIEGAAHETA